MTTEIVYKRLYWSDISLACLHIYSEMKEKNYKCDAIIGLSRGGVIPARIFADYFNILMDFFIIDVKMYNGIGVCSDKPIIKPFYLDIGPDKSILVVDDIWDSGKSILAVLDLIPHKNITTATMCWKKTSEKKPDYHFYDIDENEWVIFPWENSEHYRLVGKTNA